MWCCDSPDDDYDYVGYQKYRCYHCDDREDEIKDTQFHLNNIAKALQGEILDLQIITNDLLELCKMYGVKIPKVVHTIEKNEKHLDPVVQKVLTEIRMIQAMM